MHVQIVRDLKASAMQWIYNTSIYSHTSFPFKDQDFQSQDEPHSAEG